MSYYVIPVIWNFPEKSYLYNKKDLITSHVQIKLETTDVLFFVVAFHEQKKFKDPKS